MPSPTSKTANEKLIDRINAVITGADEFDKPVLTYIRRQITPTGLERRGEDNQDVKHLHEVAATRLKKYETKETSDQ